MNAPYERVVEVDGARLSVVGHPLRNARGTVVIAPGFAEHAGRYSRLLTDLAARGYAGFVYDPRGHGRSTGPRGHTPSWGHLVADLGAVVDRLEAEGSLAPRRALWASSMGALVAAEWMPGAGRGRMHGLVLVAPYFAAVTAPPPGKRALARTIGALLPRLAQAHGLRGRQMSHDPNVIAAYDADPAICRVMTAGYFNAMRAAQVRVQAAGAAAVEVPVLLVHGAGDPIASLEAARAWMRRGAAAGSEEKVYPGLLHEPLNEPGGGRVFAEVARWLDHRILDVTRPGP
jgi:alpha-beta hydrolase superfamily lysophospholipase